MPNQMPETFQPPAHQLYFTGVNNPLFQINFFNQHVDCKEINGISEANQDGKDLQSGCL
jgi:hypothetical protein